jgi:hypothetical protein
VGKNWSGIQEHLPAFADRTRQAGYRVAAAAGLGLAISAASAARADDPLRISIAEGHTLNEFYRDGPVAAHLVLRSGDAPRFLVAFPAGNSGVALWFSTETPLNWSPEIEIQGASEILADGAERHGVIAELTAEGGPIRVEQAVLSNVRVIRDYEDNGALPAEVAAEPIVNQTSVVWDRRRLDGGGGYRLAIDVLEGSVSGGSATPVTFAPGPEGTLRLRVTALTGDTPLTPLAEDHLLSAEAAQDPRLRSALAFLSYEEKLLAGSWRFNTYFGRDTLMSIHLLAPVLEPAGMEAGLRAVIERLKSDGGVAHEEDVGEFAILRRLAEGEPADDAPILDYKMIDDDYMLPVVAEHYLLEMADADRAAAFLARTAGDGESYGAALARNFAFVIDAAAPFAAQPGWQRLIELKPGQKVGNWRDSELGLGNGRYPYDVNAVFVPAALAAIGRIADSGLLTPHIDSATARTFAGATALAKVWLDSAPPLFAVLLDPADAREEIGAYAAGVGVDAAAALATIGNEPVRFYALALDARGAPVPVQNSDAGFALLFLDLPPDTAVQIGTSVARPFPAGLLTGVGLVVANPAFAETDLEPAFDRSRYHGTVIWSWHQAVLAAGLARQLERTDLPLSGRAALQRARDKLLAAITAAGAVRGSELWSWSQVEGTYRVEPFGQRAGDETESNAAQLWSTVHLARD